MEVSLSYNMRSPRISNFCYMTTDNGVVRYDVYPGTQEYEVTYYLFIRRFEGFENHGLNYHIRLNSASEENQYEFRMAPEKTGHRKNLLQGMKTGVYDLSLSRSVFDGTQRPVKMSVNGGESARLPDLLSPDGNMQKMYIWT